jgi:hypothetical protein
VYDVVEDRSAWRCHYLEVGRRFLPVIALFMDDSNCLDSAIRVA